MMRVGSGIDVHAFGPGDHVMLGGVRIPHTHGVVAHSDGDVILHACVEAFFLVSKQVIALICNVKLSSSLSFLSNDFKAGSVTARGVYQKQTVVIVACQEALLSQLYVSSKESQVANLALFLGLVLELGIDQRIEQGNRGLVQPVELLGGLGVRIGHELRNR